MGSNTKGDTVIVTVNFRILPQSAVWAKASLAEMRTPATASRLRWLEVRRCPSGDVYYRPGHGSLKLRSATGTGFMNLGDHLGWAKQDKIKMHLIERWTRKGNWQWRKSKPREGELRGCRAKGTQRWLCHELTLSTAEGQGRLAQISSLPPET